MEMLFENVNLHTYTGNIGKLFENQEKKFSFKLNPEWELKIKEYFGKYNIKLTNKFNLQKLLDIYQNNIDIVPLICILVNVKVMEDIANGNYKTLKILDENLFDNDLYDELIDNI